MRTTPNGPSRLHDAVVHRVHRAGDVLVSSIVASDAFVHLVHELAKLAQMSPDTAMLLRVLDRVERSLAPLDRAIAAGDLAAVGRAARDMCGIGLVALHVIGAYRGADEDLQQRLVRLHRMACRMVVLAGRFVSRDDIAMLQRLLPSDESWPTERLRASA
jgi:hypothetical protein